MKKSASPTQMRGQWFGVLAAVLMGAASTPAMVMAKDLNGARRVARTASASPAAHHSRLTVAVGATSGERHSREMLAHALQDSIAQNPALELRERGGAGTSIVLNAHVRSLTVQRDAAGVLARCDVGVVVADGNGAVRAMLDARRIVRGDIASIDDELAQTALRGAVDGAMRNLVTEMAH